MDQSITSLQDKIRSAALAQGIDPDVALKVANAESTLSNAAKNPRSSARGLFQIIDSTWKALGGDPKLRNDVDENIRIGLKAIASNRDSFLKRYGKEPTQDQIYGMHFLGPGQAFKVFNAGEDAAIKNIVPPKVIKANPFLDKMSVADFIGFTQNKMAKRGTVPPSTTAVAKTEAPVPMPQAPKETMRQVPTKAPASRPAAMPMDRNMLAELGPSYQAALGAITLADTADEDDDELLAEKYAERFGDQGNEVTPSTLSDVQLTYASPFEEPMQEEVQPVKMAFGGIPYKPSAIIPSAVKGAVGEAQKALESYNQQVGSYNAQLEDYRRRVDEYNNQFSDYENKFNQYRSSYVGGETPVVFIKSKGGTYQAAIGKADPISQRAPNLNVSEYGKIPQLGNVIGYYIRQGEYSGMSEPGAPRAPGGEPTAPTQPNIQATQAAVDAAKAKQRRLQLTYDVMEDPARFNLSMPAMFAEGGEASASDMLKQLKQAVVPAQLRTFLETVAMKKEDRAGSPITEKDFSESELRQILDTIGTARKNRTAEKRYNDNYKPSAKEQKENDELFKKAFGTSDTALKAQREKMQAEKEYFQSGKGSVNYMDYPGYLSGVRDSTLSKEGAIRNTLGRFVYETLPDGRIRVKDTYDFKDDLVTELGQRPSSAYKDMSTMGKLGTILVDTLNNPVDLQSEEGGMKVGRATLPSRVGSAFIGQNGRPVDITLDPRELMPGYAGYAHGGPVHRADGSPIYGEIPDSGPITADTRAAMSNFQVPNAREAMAALKKIYGEGASNLESLVRGSVAAVPGTAGDIGQEFDIRGLRNLPTTEQLLAKYPQRLTQPTAETAGYENVGQYIPPPIPPAAVSGTAKTLMDAFKKAAPAGPTTDQRLRALFGGTDYVTPTGNVVQAVPQVATPAARSADQLFVGRVDEFLANQKNPVTKEQLIGQLKGKFRDYEIARVEQALADLPATSKLQPADLLARVKNKYPVENFRTSIIEPKSGVVYSNVDNVYGGDIGVINLSLPVADVARKTSDEAMLTLNSLNNFGNGKFNPSQIEQITNYLKEKGLSSNYKELLNSFKAVENSSEMKKLTAAKETLIDVGRTIMYPSTHPKEAEIFARLKKQYPRKSVSELLPLRDMEMSKIGLKELTELTSDPKFKPLQYLTSALKREIDAGQLGRTSDIIGKINVETSLLDQQFKSVIDTLVPKAARDEYTKLGKELKNKRIYEGQHNAITGTENPIAFSRFVDKVATIPGRGKTKTMHVVELQSDLFDDIIKKGSKAGSKEKDFAEVADLEKKAFQIEHSGPFQREAVDKLKSISVKQYSTPAEKSEAIKEVLDRYPDIKTQLIDYIKVSDRSEKLKARATVGDYGMDEAFAGMEKSPQVLQQLMIKNTIGAAMQRGVNAITFPGKESQQSQLYEKLGPNLKQVVKDLGKGFEIRPIELYDDFGKAYMHQGIVWDNDTAARVLKEGIKFNQGGAVDKNNLDYAKYI